MLPINISNITRFSALVLTVLVLTLASSALAGKVYFYVDNNGTYHFSDQPKSDRYDKAMVWEQGSSLEVMLVTDNEYHRLILSACRLYDVEPALIKAMIRVESNYNKNAVSKAGAQGLMQLMPGTARLVRVNNSFDPRENIFGGVCYLKSLLNRYNGDVQLALAGYNAGPGAVGKYNGVPPYKETKKYIRLVLQYREYYRKKQAPSEALNRPRK